MALTMSDSDVRALANEVQYYEQRDLKRKDDAKKKDKAERGRFAKLCGIAASAGGGALVGMWHGRGEDGEGNLFIPHTSIPADLAVGVTGSLLAYWASTKAGDDPTKNFGANVLLDGTNGFLAGATAIYFRKHTQAGKAQKKFWAGIPELMGPATRHHPAIGAVPPGYLPAPQSMTDAELAASLRRVL